MRESCYEGYEGVSFDWCSTMADVVTLLGTIESLMKIINKNKLDPNGHIGKLTKLVTDSIEKRYGSVLSMADIGTSAFSTYGN